MNQPIVITGFMAAGKTTVAQALARLLNCSVIDLDQLISESEERSPTEFIEQDGEKAFREVETRHLLTALGSGPNLVLALGGGAWTRHQNRRLIAAHNGFIVWLDAPFDLCWQRISAGNVGRPLAPNKEQTQRLYDERQQFYALATFHLSADSETDADELAARIAAAILKAE